MNIEQVCALNNKEQRNSEYQRNVLTLCDISKQKFVTSGQILKSIVSNIVILVVVFRLLKYFKFL